MRTGDARQQQQQQLMQQQRQHLHQLVVVMEMTGEDDCHAPALGAYRPRRTCIGGLHNIHRACLRCRAFLSSRVRITSTPLKRTELAQELTSLEFEPTKF